LDIQQLNDMFTRESERATLLVISTIIETL